MTAQPSPGPNAVLTIGHSNRTFEEFVSLLLGHRITLVADVRKMPGSRRNPHFNKDVLSPALFQKSIGYVHLAGLGGLRRPAAASPNTGWQNRSFQAYADYMLTAEFESSLAELLERAGGERAALMCAEAVPWRCHRSLIADALVVRGISVEHILSASRTQPHSLRPWAHVQGTRIEYPPPDEQPPGPVQQQMF